MIFTLCRRQSKTLILSQNIYQNLLETELSIAICRQSGDKLQSKTLFLTIFDRCSLIVKSIFDCRISGVILFFFKKVKQCNILY